MLSFSVNAGSGTYEEEFEEIRDSLRKLRRNYHDAHERFTHLYVAPIDSLWIIPDSG